jgi:hypothetical protein
VARLDFGPRPGADGQCSFDWVDVGPNLSVTGSLATILWLLALRKDAGGDTGGERLDVSFWKFLKVGAIPPPRVRMLGFGLNWGIFKR